MWNEVKESFNDLWHTVIIPAPAVICGLLFALIICFAIFGGLLFITSLIVK